MNYSPVTAGAISAHPIRGGVGLEVWLSNRGGLEFSNWTKVRIT